jgi:uncharacterized membrane protein YjfL (UPF0719 family)
MNVSLVSWIPLLAAVPGPDFATWSVNLMYALAGTAAFGFLGILLMVVGFKAFEWITARLDVEKQLSEGNYAVAIVVAAIMLSLSWIIVHSMT